jgi:hypothetical protein
LCANDTITQYRPWNAGYSNASISALLQVGEGRARERDIEYRGFRKRPWSELKKNCLFLALLVLLGAAGSGGWCARVDQDGVVIATTLGVFGGGTIVEFLHEVLLDGGAALFPPCLLLVRLALDLLEPLAQHRIGVDLVGGLENVVAPAGCESVGLYTRKKDFKISGLVSWNIEGIVVR